MYLSKYTISCFLLASPNPIKKKKRRWFKNIISQKKSNL